MKLWCFTWCAALWSGFYGIIIIITLQSAPVLPRVQLAYRPPPATSALRRPCQSIPPNQPAVHSSSSANRQSAEQIKCNTNPPVHLNSNKKFIQLSHANSIVVNYYCDRIKTNAENPPTTTTPCVFCVRPSIVCFRFYVRGPKNPFFEFLNYSIRVSHGN